MSCSSFFFLNDTATTEIYTYCHTPSLHDALPIWENLPPANVTRYTAPRPQPPCPSAMDQPDLDQLRRKLSELKSEHRDLDDVISHLVETRPFDQLQLQRLKKRKLALKDQILKLEDALLPDIIA